MAFTPVFFGSYDWHSCVEMHWVLARLLRMVPGFVPADDVRATLNRQFQPDALAREAAFIAGPDGRRERPYGWGWALTLIAEVAALADGGDADARRWSAALAPLADAITGCFIEWLRIPAWHRRRPADVDLHSGHRVRFHRRPDRPPARP